MKKLSILFMTAILLVACQNTYKITGKVGNQSLEGTNIYLQEETEAGLVNVDTAVVQNAEFVFEGVADSTVIRFLALENEDENQKPHLVVLEPGNIQVAMDSMTTVTGTKLNQDYASYKQDVETLIGKSIEIRNSYEAAMNNNTMTDSLREELIAQNDKIGEDINTKQFEFVKSNITNVLGKYLFTKEYADFSVEKQKEILALTDANYKSQENVKKIIERIENMDKVSVGQKFVDFTMKDPADKDVSLSDYAGKGKVVLIDFWASWCNPCLAEMPTLVEAYKKYKDKGFEIVGVSLDQDKAKWVNELKKSNMTWPQMSDLKLWDSHAREIYFFDYIPYTVLLDKDGTILARELRGEDLQKKLVEIFGE